MILLVAASLLLFHSASGAQNSTVKSLCPLDVVKDVGESKYFSVAYDTCFLFATSIKVTYDKAVANCKDLGGKIVMPKTMYVNDFLLSEIERLPSSDQGSPFWIGMTDRKNEGNMVWEDGTAVKDLSNLVTGAGGVLGSVWGHGEDCVALDPRDGKWHDYRCLKSGLVAKNSKLPYICQFPVSNVLQRFLKVFHPDYHGF
ncbi:C-type lectin domain family 11 member A [Elysia marginata]|uniref:C-type lectin domain family 11 member A n=1 Tax=Elysia marginata TaxID=1093978 RepID=A0AAV4FLU8_9GAST|nr:C-type lectin domain family 11 member A [Elysia marginata]